MLNTGKDLAAVLQALEDSQSTHECWRSDYGGRQREEATPLKQLDDEHRRLDQLVADQATDTRFAERERSVSLGRRMTA